MNILEKLGLKDPLMDDAYIEWRTEMDEIRDSRSIPAEGLTPFEKLQSEILARRWIPVYGGPQKERRLPITGGKLVDIDGIAAVPWPDDINISPISFYRKKTDKMVHYISMSADGPNADGTMHHGALEYLPDYPDRETMLQSAADLAVLVYRLTGHKPLIILTSEESNQHAGWCMGQNECPKGYDYDRFIDEQI